jgi:4-nitrophenyl phosphatase
MDIHQIKALILDADGVVWKGDTPIGDLKGIFKSLDQMGIGYCFATNNSSKTIEKYLERFKDFHIPITKEQIYTSGKTTAEILRQRYPKGGKVFVVGMAGLKETLKEAGFDHSEENPLAVVVGLDTEVTYSILSTATILIRQGIPFIATNADKTFPSPEGLVPGAGSIVAALIASSDKKPEVIGKPHPPIFEAALRYLNKRPEKVLVVGDRLETDIAGGQATGCKTAAVLSGVSSRETCEAWEPPPDVIADNLSQIIDML